MSDIAVDLGNGGSFLLTLGGEVYMIGFDAMDNEVRACVLIHWDAGRRVATAVMSRAWTKKDEQ